MRFVKYLKLGNAVNHDEVDSGFQKISLKGKYGYCVVQPDSSNHSFLLSLFSVSQFSIPPCSFLDFWSFFGFPAHGMREEFPHQKLSKSWHCKEGGGEGSDPFLVDLSQFT